MPPRQRTQEVFHGQDVVTAGVTQVVTQMRRRGGIKLEDSGGAPGLGQGQDTVTLNGEDKWTGQSDAELMSPSPPRAPCHPRYPSLSPVGAISQSCK